MRRADTILSIHQERGSRGLPLERVYKHLFNPELFLRAYGKIYRNFGAMTRGSTAETVDGMDRQRILNIIGFLKTERYDWTPVRRTEIPKANGKMRPLGIPTWSDKLLQEVMRTLLEPYYEQRFSNRSHGFRPNRGCHTALKAIRDTWKGTAWFIEGDIKGCFDNIDHLILLKIIRRDIHDGRFVKLVEGLLKAGYLEDWRYHDTLSGTPQGGIISPLLANIYLDEMDRFVEDTLIPAYTNGKERRDNPVYANLRYRIATARKRGNLDMVKRLVHERRKLMSGDPTNPNYRRLRYVRYADDFLMGFVGPKKEAEEIRRRLGEWLRDQLRLTLSEEKTLITHANDEKAKFLGHEITVTREGSLVAEDGRRATNGCITLLMPQRVVQKYRERHTKEGKVTHRTELLNDTVYTIIQRYQSVMRGIYNFYCMTPNVSRRMSRIEWILELSLVKTLASKHKCSVPRIYAKYRTTTEEVKVLRVEVERPGKDPLVATFGGIPFIRIPDGMGPGEVRLEAAWFSPGDKRSEVVQRLTAGKCELCGIEDMPVQVHHIRQLRDIDRPGRRPKEPWEKIMAARKRKTLVVCLRCHGDIHAGRYDGPRLRQ